MSPLSELLLSATTMLFHVASKGLHVTEAAAKAYLEFLYTPEAQEIIARNYYRPSNVLVAAKYARQFPIVNMVTRASHAVGDDFAKQFPAINLITVDEAFGGWATAQKEHFADGGIFDQIYTKK